MTYRVSACCLKSIVNDVRLEYPLGGRTYAIPYKVERCEGCGLEIDNVGETEVCETCGLELCEGDCEQLEFETECEGHEISSYSCY